MAGVHLYGFQMEALSHIHNGCILNGGVGSGKSRTSLAYYYTQHGGKVYLEPDINDKQCTHTFKENEPYVKMKDPCDLYIITTARKRDTLEWEKELLPFYISPTNSKNNFYKNKIIIDSWNNIHNYIGVKNSFFIFDEQRVVGYGTWVKSFLIISEFNKWMLLSATPGDTWTDYMPVFIANGFYRNKTDFYRRHVVLNPFIKKYPSIMKYTNEGHLQRLRNSILVNMDFQRDTVPHHIQIECTYDKYNYDYVVRNRWDIYSHKPLENASAYCTCLRRIVNSDQSRQQNVLDIVKTHPTAIIFYSYDYELEILRKLFENYPHSEWNGHKHEPILTGSRWVYLVQYTAGSEGWNCITTDTIIFYSQSYSYKAMEQAAGRIDRINTKYINLYYYHLKSPAKIDVAINKSLGKKKQFNERGFAPDFTKLKPVEIPDSILKRKQK